MPAVGEIAPDFELKKQDGETVKLSDYRGKKVFADLKLYDIPETVGRAVKNLAKHDIDLLTIHASSRAIMTQAVANKGDMDLLAVTALTCLDQNDLNEMGFNPDLSLEDQVIKKAALAIDCGVGGVVASAHEAKTLRANLGNDFKIVTPGIRLEESNDDQKRVTTPARAVESGADYLVIGRPITRASDPRGIVMSL